MREARQGEPRVRMARQRGKVRAGTRTEPGFTAEHEPETLAAEQGVSPVTDFDELLGDFWPEDERVEDFIATLREWRRESGTKVEGSKGSRRAG